MNGHLERTGRGLYIGDGILSIKGISWAEKGILAQIQQLSKRYGYCWASNQELGDYMGVDASTVKRALKNLEAGGYLSKKRGKRGERELRCLLKLEAQDRVMLPVVEGQNAPLLEQEARVKMTHPRVKMTLTQGQNAPLL